MRRPNALLNAGLAALIFLVPLAWTRSLNAEFTLAKFFILNAALAFCAWAAFIKPEGIPAGKTALDGPLATGLAILCLSSAAARDPSTSLAGRYDSYAYGLWGFALLAATAQFSARSARGQEDFLARSVAASAAIVGGYGVLQRLGFDPIFHFPALPQGRAVSSLGSPIDLGALLALAFPLSLWNLDQKRAPFAAAAAACIAGGLLACGSRGACLGAAVGAASYWMMSRREPKSSTRAALGFVLGASALAIAWTWRPGAAPTDAGRREVWKIGLALFSKRPWLGWGPDGFEDAFRMLRGDAFVAVLGSTRHQAYAHNDVIQALAALGLFGAAAYAYLLATLARCVWKDLEVSATRALAAGLAAGLLALWITLQLNPVALEVLALAAVIGGLLASLAAPAETGCWPRAALLACAVLASASFFVSFGMIKADKAFKAAAKAQAAGDFPAARRLFAQARQGAPCLLDYRLAEVNAIGDWINATHDINERLALLALADEDGREAIRCHPRKVNAHYIAGAAARMHADLGLRNFLPIAAREFDEALFLDPMFEPLISARLQIARQMGDAKRAQELERLLSPRTTR